MRNRTLPALAALTFVTTGLLTAAPSAHAAIPKCVPAIHGAIAHAKDGTYWQCNQETGWHLINPYNCGGALRSCDINGRVKPDIREPGAYSPY